nr:MAG TPA: hypothetical protein [Caudoviricetes sp.]
MSEYYMVSMVHFQTMKKQYHLNALSLEVMVSNNPVSS